MTEIVPNPDGQAALFEDPARLLQINDVEFDRLVGQAKAATRPAIAQLRRVGGLLAWAGWHRLSGRNYGVFVAELAEHFETSDPTILRWRRKVVATEHLAVPVLAKVQQRERAAAVATRHSPRSKATPNQSDRELSTATPPPPPDPPAPAPVRRAAPRAQPPRVVPPPPDRTITDIETLIVWLQTTSTGAITAIPVPLRASVLNSMRRWIRIIEAAPEGPTVEDCPHPISRRIGGRCAACGGKP